MKKTLHLHDYTYNMSQ